MNARLCDAHMRDGVTIVDPATTYLEPELEIGADTVIYPNTTIGGSRETRRSAARSDRTRGSRNARLGARVTVRESVVIDSAIGAAHDRSGRSRTCAATPRSATDVQIGNFVEIKKSRLDDGVKASHLSYLGDAVVGNETNIGAGTITCNYDGENKNETVIGSDVFIGSNSSLVAPVTIGDGALTGAGSVVTRDVAPGERVAGNPARPLPKK